MSVQAKSGLTRGYVRMGGESGSDAYEVKEAFSYGYEWPENTDAKIFNSLQGFNIWPNNLELGDEWKSTMNEFFTRMIRISHLVTEGLSLSLSLSVDHLDKFCTDGDTISIMRVFKYFPYEIAHSSEAGTRTRIGSSPHTDWGFLTLILQDHQPDGLEAFVRGRWQSVPSRTGTILVNCGDYLSMLTEGRYISPLHRVTTSAKERISFVLFFYPSFDSRVQVRSPSQIYSLLRDQYDHFGVGDPQLESVDGHVATPSREDIATENMAHGIAGRAFGDYIAEKWRQVSRSTSEVTYNEITLK